VARPAGQQAPGRLPVPLLASALPRARARASLLVGVPALLLPAVLAWKRALVSRQVQESRQAPVLPQAVGLAPVEALALAFAHVP